MHRRFLLVVGALHACVLSNVGCGGGISSQDASVSDAGGRDGGDGGGDGDGGSGDGGTGDGGVVDGGPSPIDAATDSSVDAGPPCTAVDCLRHGIERTMQRLEAAGPTEIRILVYGQSINDSNARWWTMLRDELQARYPRANLRMETRARGGCSAACLLGQQAWGVDGTTADRLPGDVFAYNPDLIIFHVYGSDADYEEVVRRMKQNTTAEILLQGDHIQWRPSDGAPCDATSTVAAEMAEYTAANNRSLTFLPRMATMYQAGFVRVREGWEAELDRRMVLSSTHLADCIHPNSIGSVLLYQLVRRHFFGDTPPLGSRILVGFADGFVRAYRVNEANGNLTMLNERDFGGDITWLTLDSRRESLFALDGTNNQVIASRFRSAAGLAAEINRVASGGMHPVHAQLAPNERGLAVANFNSDTVTMLPVATNGQLSPAGDTEVAGDEPHGAYFAPGGPWLFVPARNGNRITRFTVGSGNGLSTPQVFTSSVAGSAPRHAAFHPANTHLYVVHELQNTVSTHTYNSNTGAIVEIGRVSTLPPGTTAVSTAAEIIAHPNGNFVFVSNRGHNSIARLRVRADRTLELIGNTSSAGQVPRSMALTASGNTLVVANQTSRTINSFLVDPATGNLTYNSAISVTSNPGSVAAFSFATLGTAAN